MASKTNIANLSLSLLGVGHEISNLDTERSEEALAIKTFYDISRDFMLSDFPWPFITRDKALALVEDEPTDEWDFSYRYPTDVMKLHRIHSPIRNDNRQSRVPYKIHSDSSGKLIYTDCEDALIEYSYKELDETKWPADFVLAFAFLLASHVTPRLMKGDPFGARKEVERLYGKYLQLAEQQNLNDEQAEEVPESEFVRARESDSGPYSEPWPYGWRY